jgi:hypothetical protein
VLTSSFWAGRNLGSVLTAGEAAALAATNCFDAVLDTDLGFSSLVNCAEAGGADAARTASRLFSFLDSGHTLKDAIGAGLGRLGMAPGNVEGSWHFHYDPIPPRPDTQPTDGSVGSGSGQGPGILLKRSNSTAAYYLVDGVAHHVPDGGTYICLAERVPTMFNVDEHEWAALVTTFGADAACPATGLPAQRSLTPETVRNFLLRTGDGSETYLVGTDGFRTPLFDGASHFNCLAESYLVWDWASAQELTRFQRHPTIAATGCL